MTTITQTHSLQTDVAVDYQFILDITEPTIPTGYTRVPELDVDMGSAGTIYAYIRIQ